jgi:DNA processing protein
MLLRKQQEDIDMKISDNALNILAATTYKGVGLAWVVKFIHGSETSDIIVARLNQHGKETSQIKVTDFENVREGIRREIVRLSGSVDGVIAIGDSEFPQYRGRVNNSERPVVLFYRGKLSLLAKANKNVAVIGLLTPDEGTEAVEIEVVKSLVEQGATIVSGLALGCDSIAHRQALHSKGNTVAILPGPLHDILPAANKSLAHEIVRQGGLLVTEYYQPAQSGLELRARYQQRDRLQALFSDCVMLTASYAKNDAGNDSGSRLAMAYALKYNIARAVMYDPDQDLTNPTYDLNRQLIVEQPDILIINRINKDTAVKRVLSLGSLLPAEPCTQPDLFS